MNLADETLFTVGGILHEARMTECYGKLQMASRQKWPTTLKNFRAQRMDGQPWIDVAIAQVRALAENELLRPIRDEALRLALPSDNSVSDVPCRISGGLGTAAQQPQSSPISVGGGEPSGVSGTHQGGAEPTREDGLAEGSPLPPDIAQPPVEDAGGEGRPGYPFQTQQPLQPLPLGGQHMQTAAFFFGDHPPSPVACVEVQPPTAEQAEYLARVKGVYPTFDTSWPVGGRHAVHRPAAPDAAAAPHLSVDEDRARSERPAPEKPAVMPEGYSAPLEIKTTRERISERLAAQSTPSPVAAAREILKKCDPAP